MPDPAPTPGPDPVPDPTPAPAPVLTAVTISIVGSFGRSAFTPNPIQASVGDMIVWTNSDTTLHDIVLDGGTVIGNIAPGRSSVPMALATATATYHCRIHESMVGSINGAAAPEPPPPVYEPPPYYDPY
jgi:plastocyanin